MFGVKGQENREQTGIKESKAGLTFKRAKSGRDKWGNKRTARGQQGISNGTRKRKTIMINSISHQPPKTISALFDNLSHVYATVSNKIDKAKVVGEKISNKMSQGKEQMKKTGKDLESKVVKTASKAKSGGEGILKKIAKKLTGQG